MKAEENLLIIEDEEDQLKRFKKYANTIFNNVHTAKSCKLAREFLVNNEVECIVADNCLSDGNGLSLLKNLKLTGGAIPIILITGYADKEMAIESVNSNLFYFLEKPFSRDTFISVLLKAGQTIKRQELHRRLMDRWTLSDDTKRLLKDRYNISKREIEIIACSLDTSNNRSIAGRLFISTGTVKKHIYSIFSKCGVSSKDELRELIYEMNRSFNIWPVREAAMDEFSNLNM